LELRVVVPTYNERDNIAELLDRLLALRDDLGVLVVDDASPDGTAEHVARVAAATGRVELLARPAKRGLGSAYRDGFARVLAAADVRWVAQMDADLSHPPDRLPALLAPLEAGDADLAVGSRYVRGGDVTHWGPGRRLLSRGANLYVRAVTGLPQRDATAGFKVWRRSLLARLPWGEIASDGYAFQIETSWHAWRLGARLVELPITFRDRAQGRSKLSGGIVREAVGLPWRLRRRAGAGS